MTLSLARSGLLRGGLARSRAAAAAAAGRSTAARGGALARRFSAASSINANGYGLSGERLMLQEMAESFADAELKPHAARWDAEHHFPVNWSPRGAERNVTPIRTTAAAR